MAIGQLTRQQLHILHCIFRFYNCTNCNQLHVTICPGRAIVNDFSLLFSSFAENFCDFILSRLESNDIDISWDATLYNVLVDQSLMNYLWSDVSSDSKITRYCKE